LKSEKQQAGVIHPSPSKLEMPLRLKIRGKTPWARRHPRIRKEKIFLAQRRSRQG
jgi:hypothetical protein